MIYSEQMSLLFSAWQLVFQRSLANWRLFSSIVIGVLIAVALLSSIPLYSNAINDLGLKHALHERASEVTNVQVYVPYYPINFESFQKNNDYINQHIQQKIGPLIRQEEKLIKSQSFFVAWTNRPVPTGSNRPYGYFQTFTNLENHVKLIEGRMANPVTSGLEIEVTMGQDIANKFRVGVGDQLIFIDQENGSPVQFVLNIVGIIEPVNVDEQYWFGNTELFSMPASDQFLIAPVFIPEVTMFSAVGGALPAADAVYNWYYYLDLDKITTQNVDAFKNNLEILGPALVGELPRSSVMTLLDRVLTQYQQKQMYSQILLFLLIFPIIGIILYYLITVSSMIMEQESAEISQLRSRGASVWQIIIIYLMQGLLFSIIGGIAGPFLGAAAFSFLGTTRSFTPLSGGELMQLRFTPAVFILAVVGIVLCLLSLLIPAIQSARYSVVYQKQHAARPPRAPFWQRYYLDIACLVLGSALYWEISTHGSFLTRSISGKLGVDPIPLITPMLFIIAAAVILLRLFPLLISLGAKISGHIANAPVVLSLRMMSRNPVHYGRLVLLLMMAASAGVFSASFLGTLSRSNQEQAMYAAGSDIRVEGLRQSDNNSQLADVPGIKETSYVYRGTATVGTLMDSVDTNTLFIDPATFSKVAWYRDDFSTMSLPQLMDLLAKDEPAMQGITLPDGTQNVGIWMHTSEPEIGVSVYFRIKDGEGKYREYELGKPSNNEWQYFEKNLADNSSGILPPSPIILDSINVITGYPQPNPAGTAFFQVVCFDNLQANGPSFTEPVVLEDYENVDDWTVIPDNYGSWINVGTNISPTNFNTSGEEACFGKTSGWLTVSVRRGTGNTDLFANLDTRPLSVVASRSFLKNAGVNVDDSIVLRLPGQYVPVVIKGVGDYFPTLDPDRKGFLIANINRASSIMNLMGSNRAYPNEVWLTADGGQRPEVISQLKDFYTGRTIYDMHASIAKTEADPLVAGGWSGILLIAFGGVILVSALGFIVYAYLLARGRQLEFAVLRTLGFSLRDIIALVGMEQIIIIGFGMGIGTILGTKLSSIMTPFLQLTAQGARVVPPYIVTTDWMTIGIAYLVIMATFMITISMVVLFFSHVALHRVLRIGDQ
jgi:ABC-type lipoprotein release transport system permease subunit